MFSYTPCDLLGTPDTFLACILQAKAYHNRCIGDALPIFHIGFLYSSCPPILINHLEYLLIVATSEGIAFFNHISHFTYVCIKLCNIHLLQKVIPLAIRQQNQTSSKRPITRFKAVVGVIVSTTTTLSYTILT